MNLSKSYSNKEIQSIIEELVKYLKLENEVDTINILQSGEQYVDGSYFPDRNELNLYMDTIASGANFSHKSFDKLTKSIDKTRFYNMFLLRIILHELTHANQNKLAKEEKNDSLHILAKDGIEFGSRYNTYNMTIREVILYQMGYNHILTEKNAECNSCKIISDIATLTSTEKEYLDRKLNQYLISDYTINRCAAEKYYRLRGKLKEYKEIPFNEDYDIYTKLSWGMPVDKELIKILKR